MADNLESFFKKRLSEDTSVEDNWNIPSDRVWENVLPEIQKEKGLFISWRNIILIVAGLLLTAMLIIFMLWNRNTNNSIAVVDAQDTLEITNNRSEKQATINKEVSTNQNKNEDIIENKEPNNRKLNNEDENIASKDIISNNKINTTNAEDINSSQDDYHLKGSTYSSVKNNIEEVAITVEDQISISDIEISKLKGFDIDIDELNNSNTQDLKGKTGRTASEKAQLSSESIFFNDKGKIGIGAFFTPTITSTYLKGNMISGIENTSPMYLYSSNYGLELKYYFSNKLAFVLGVGKSEIKSWSKSNVDFNYNTSTEQEMPNGDKSNTSDIPMPTPFGDVATSVTYHFPGSAVLPDGEVMQSVMETHQRIQYLSIPLGAEYKLMSKNRINWIVEGGFRFNKSVIDGSEFTSRILHEGHDMEVVEEQQTGNPDFKDIYFNYYIGTGFNYRIKKSLQFNASLRYLNNIDDVNLQNNMSTNVHEFNLKVGILYLF